jgi:hypothetical protein
MRALAKRVGGHYSTDERDRRQRFACGGWVDLDGLLQVGAFRVVVEVESRTSKQIRGAVLDLLTFDACPKKLLVILPVHQGNAALAAAQCRELLGRFLPTSDFQVAMLTGSGAHPKVDADVEQLLCHLHALGLPY